MRQLNNLHRRPRITRRPSAGKPIASHASRRGLCRRAAGERKTDQTARDVDATVGRKFAKGVVQGRQLDHSDSQKGCRQMFANGAVFVVVMERRSTRSVCSRMVVPGVVNVFNIVVVVSGTVVLFRSDGARFACVLDGEVRGTVEMTMGRADRAVYSVAKPTSE